MKNSKKYKTINLNNNRCETTPCISHSVLNTHSKKEEFLFSHKTSLEMLLSVIKNSQISFLSNISKNNKISKKNIKQILLEFKDNLNTMYNEQNAKTEFFQSLAVKQKSVIQNQLFENIKKNKIFQNLKDEIEQLKELNFKAQNDIKYIENLIIKNNNIEQYLNKNKNIVKKDFPNEINCIKPKLYSMVSYLLHRKDIETKKYFKYLVSTKQRQNDQMSYVTKSIEQLKYLIYNKENGYSNYIYAEDIIPEESKEYTKSVTINNINNTINKIIFNQNKIDINNNNDKDEYVSDNSSVNSIENNIDDKNEGNKLNNYINVNMNINFNFNFDKIYNITDDIKYNSDRIINNNNDKNTSNLKHKKGNASTGNLPYLIIKSITEEKISPRKNIEKEDNCKYKTVVTKDIAPEELISKI